MNNNPVRYTDPNGHRVSDGCDTEGCTTTNYNLKDPKQASDFNHAVKQYNKTKGNKEGIDNLSVMATLLDNMAAGLNGIYAVVGDLVSYVCIGCAPGVLATYQIYSFIPNGVSLVAGGLWSAQGILTGETDFSITSTSEGTAYSIYLAQDSIVAATTNFMGFNIREPNTATLLDGAVFTYDFFRGPSAGLKLPTLPTLINPNLSYSTSTGFSFSWK